MIFWAARVWLGADGRLHWQPLPVAATNITQWTYAAAKGALLGGSYIESIVSAEWLQTMADLVESNGSTS